MMHGFCFSLVLALTAVLPEQPAQSSPSAPKRDPTKMKSLTGSYSSAWGPVHLEQNGDIIVGAYECCGGGRIEGKIKGDLIRFRWRQPDDAGSGRWKIKQGGKRLIGTWGSGLSESNGGKWNLKRIRKP